jgi:SAM-dependent methyltransferase
MTSQRTRATARANSIPGTASTGREQQIEGARGTDAKRYDRAYFDRWYRHPGHRVRTSESLVRKVRMVMGVAEYVLGRPIRTVLDIGCGEAEWFVVLRRLRPSIDYVGLDPSPYVIRRYGRRRRIRQGSLADLDRLRRRREVDMVVCADVLQYVPAKEVGRGLAAIRRLVRGVAYVEAFAAEDEMEGDRAGWNDRSAAWYRRRFRDAGLVQCGPYCYLDPRKHDNLNVLEHM